MLFYFFVLCPDPRSGNCYLAPPSMPSACIPTPTHPLIRYGYEHPRIHLSGLIIHIRTCNNWLCKLTSTRSIIECIHLPATIYPQQYVHLSSTHTHNHTYPLIVFYTLTPISIYRHLHNPHLSLLKKMLKYTYLSESLHPYETLTPYSLAFITILYFFYLLFSLSAVSCFHCLANPYEH